MAELDDFGISYDGYSRIADSPERLLQVVRPVIRALDAGKPVPTWARVDLLRASLFFVHRRGHYSGPSHELERQFRVLVGCIREIVGDSPLTCDSFG